MVHDYLERPGPYRMSASTANSVLVDALTTILGFGALMVASHRGLESLGRLLTLGVTTCTVTSLVFLPAVLTWMRPAGQDEDQTEPAEAEDTSETAADPDRTAESAASGRLAA